MAGRARRVGLSSSSRSADRSPQTRLSAPDSFLTIAEVTPPEYADPAHLAISWRHVLVTDNPFRAVRVSPYAFSARITHDSPAVRPTVVVSTRDRNRQAIESEVRGAVWNGVTSFLVVQGDDVAGYPAAAQAADVTRHLVGLSAPEAIEVGMTAQTRRGAERRLDAGAQFLVSGPVMDAAAARRACDRLGDVHVPVYLALIPPFSPAWVSRMAQLGVEPPAAVGRSRDEGWAIASATRDAARALGFSGVVLMGLHLRTLDEASERLGE